ncbi:MAG: Molybdenum cofactor biosynthesis protein MoaD, partial [uncultured Rubrobacteraceae bacterium]
GHHPHPARPARRRRRRARGQRRRLVRRRRPARPDHGAPRDRLADLRPGGRPQPLRERLPQRRGRARAGRARHAGRRSGLARDPACHGRRGV